MSDDERTRDQLSRIDTKLDVLIAQHGHVASTVDDHESRIRDLETAKAKDEERTTTTDTVLSDHEDRLRASDRWRYAIPLTATGAVLAGAASIIAAVKG